jgi:hypothetical protein
MNFCTSKRPQLPDSTNERYKSSAAATLCTGSIRTLVVSALFCWSGFGLVQLVSAYFLSQNTIESAEISRLLYPPN